MKLIACTLALSLAAGACVSEQHPPVSEQAEPHDPHKRQVLLDSVKALEGTWEEKAADGSVHVVEFKVSSAGSAVREIMFPGTGEEMTNLYTLDGNSLRMTHYCAMGNQPQLAALERKGNELEFRLIGVRDMETPDEMYMGGLVLEFVDQDHVTERWSSYVGGELQKDHGVVIALARKK